MSDVQPLSHLQQTAESVMDVQELKFWLDKAVTWGQAENPDTQRDTRMHLSRLRNFLQGLNSYIDSTRSTEEAMKSLPLLGQFLGRLCWNPLITAGDSTRKLLLQCLFGLYSEHPSTAVERKANQWIRKVLCQLATEEDDAAAQILMKNVGVPPKEYHLRVLRKTVGQLQKHIGKSCSSLSDINQRCPQDEILKACDACVPLVTCPEALPFIGALLQQPETLREDFMDALSSAYSSQSLLLEEQALVSLWYRSLPSLEEAVLRLLESAAITGSSLQEQEQLVEQSLLPKACAQHCSMFLVVSDMFRYTLQQAERSECLKSLIQTFTCSLLGELALLQPKTCVPLKAFFPHAHPSLLPPLLTRPSEMPQETWRNHLNWLSGSLQRLTEEEEEGDEDGSSSGGKQRVFDAWFLLIQCGYWVKAALQLLVTSGPEDCDPLLWLLTFYHHPTNKWHHRTSQLVQAKKVWEHLHALCSPSPQPPPTEALLSLLPPSLPPSLSVNLLVNFAVFSQLPLTTSSQLLQTVVDQCGAADEAARLLNSLKRPGCSSTDRVHLRIQGLQNAIAHMHST